MKYIFVTVLSIMTITFISCTKKAALEKETVDISALTKLLNEADQKKNIKIISKEKYTESIKSDLPDLKKQIQKCLRFSKKYELKNIPGSDLQNIKAVALKLDYYNEKYTIERTEENPMLTFDLNHPLERDWVAVVSLAHNICIDFSKYFPKTKNATGFKTSYKNLNLIRKKNFNESLKEFIEKYSI